MKIKLKNLGAIKQAEFELGDFTLICGTNNTGKTYATYALFAFLYRWQSLLSVIIEDSMIEHLFNDGVIQIDLTVYQDNYAEILAQGCKKYTQLLPTVFSAPEAHFSQAQFQIILDKKPSLMTEFDTKIQSENAEIFSLYKTKENTNLVVSLLAGMEQNRLPPEIIKDIISDVIVKIVFSELFPSPFISSTERTGAAIFTNELDFSRNRLLKEMHNLDHDIDPRTLLFKSYQDYALPVEQNVDFIRKLPKITKESSFINKEYSEILDDFADIIGGNYTITGNNQLFFMPNKTKIKLSIDESSSAVRSLLDIGFYLRHVAKKGDLLMVDEPELNLHPENQRRIVRLFSRLIKIGIKVFITTHSDYIVKELNTLIMLNHDDPYLRKIAAVEGYHEYELISAKKIKVYIAKKDLVKLDGKSKRSRCQTLIPAKIDPELGIEAGSFDETINKMNEIQESVVWRDNCA